METEPILNLLVAMVIKIQHLVLGKSVSTKI